MSTLKFSDGISINTDGLLRTMELFDRWYVVGQGSLIPCYDEFDAKHLLSQMQIKEEEQS